MGGNSLPRDCNAWAIGKGPHVNPAIPAETTLLSLINKYQAKNVAEIGVLRGGLTWQVVKRCKVDNYYCVDPWKPYPEWGDLMPLEKQEEFKNAPRSAHLFSQDWYDNLHAKVQAGAEQHSFIKIIRKESVEAAKDFEDGQLDLVYLDGIHDFPNGINDIMAWLPKIKNKGIMAGHDYMTRFLGLIRAVDYAFGEDFILPRDRTGNFFGEVWFVNLTMKRKARYLAHLRKKFPNPTALLDPQNKYMHHEKTFIERLYSDDEM